MAGVAMGAGRHGRHREGMRGRPRRALRAVVAAMVVLAGETAQAQVAAVGVTRNALGVLVLTRADGRSERLQGQGALPVFEGDELKTGPGAKALIEFNDGTRVALNEQTTVEIRSRQERGPGLTRILRLLLGELWVKTSAAPRPLEVETPVANAAIRGTEFNIRVFPDGHSVLTVVEGAVDFGNAFGTWPIGPGAMSMAERGKRCTPPVRADVASATAWIGEVVK